MFGVRRIKLMNINHTCDACGTTFNIQYNAEDTETDPNHCPFCAEYLHIPDHAYEDEDYDE